MLHFINFTNSTKKYYDDYSMYPMLRIVVLKDTIPIIINVVDFVIVEVVRFEIIHYFLFHFEGLVAFVTGS